MNEARDEANASVPPKGPKPPNNNLPEPPEPLKEFSNNIGTPLMHSMWAWSIPGLARHIPILSKIYNVNLKIQDDAAANKMRLVNKYSKIYDEHGWQNIKDAHDILSHMRLSEQRITKDDQGRLAYTSPDGVKLTLSNKITKAIEDVTDYQKEHYRMLDEVLRNHLNDFKDEKLDSTSSLSNVKRVLDSYDEKIKGNPLPELASMYQQRKTALGRIYGHLKEANETLNNETPYVPFIRFGDYVVDVVDRKTGDIVHLEPINDFNMFGNQKARLPTKRQRRRKDQSTKTPREVQS